MRNRKICTPRCINTDDPKVMFIVTYHLDNLDVYNLNLLINNYIS